MKGMKTKKTFQSVKIMHIISIGQYFAWNKCCSIYEGFHRHREETWHGKWRTVSSGIKWSHWDEK